MLPRRRLPLVPSHCSLAWSALPLDLCNCVQYLSFLPINSPFLLMPARGGFCRNPKNVYWYSTSFSFHLCSHIWQTDLQLGKSGEIYHSIYQEASSTHSLTFSGPIISSSFAKRIGQAKYPFLPVQILCISASAIIFTSWTYHKINTRGGNTYHIGAESS